MTDATELAWRLNQYRAAEIRGGSVILRLSKMAETSHLRADLTKHLRDEANHAWTWTRLLLDMDAEITDVDDPYQGRLGSHFGLPRTIEEILALTVVSERRGVATYEEHLAEPDVTEPVQRALRAVLKDETWHVDWITDELMRRADGADEAGVLDALRRAEEADRVTMAELRAEAGAVHTAS